LFFCFCSFRANLIQILESFVDPSIDLVFLKPLTVAMALQNFVRNMSTESDDEGNIISLSLQISKSQLRRKKALLNRAKEGLISNMVASVPRMAYVKQESF
jgi:hypothetical protein